MTIWSAASMVAFAEQLSAAIRTAATASDWQEPLRRRYGALLLTLMGRPAIRANRAYLDNLCDRFERLMVASEGDS